MALGIVVENNKTGMFYKNILNFVLVCPVKLENGYYLPLRAFF